MFVPCSPDDLLWAAERAVKMRETFVCSKTARSMTAGGGGHDDLCRPIQYALGR